MSLKVLTLKVYAGFVVEIPTLPPVVNKFPKVFELPIIAADPGINILVVVMFVACRLDVLTSVLAYIDPVVIFV